MPTFSIVIPALNEEATIGALLEALRAQERHGDTEVIVVDGGSTDCTAEVVRQFPEVRLVMHTPAGAAAQRNRGGALASNDILVFMDADTVPAPTFIARLAATLDQRPCAVACPWFVPQTRNPPVHLVYGLFNSLFWLSQWRYHTGAGVCIVTPRSVFDTVGGFDENMHLGEDVHYIRRACAHGRHRHLPIALPTSARRFEAHGVGAMLWFYLRISRLLLRNDYRALQRLPYAPVRKRGQGC